jgi:hypothetical protein
MYSFRPVILFANIDVSRYILVINIYVLAKSNMGQREYYNHISRLGECNTVGFQSCKLQASLA